MGACEHLLATVSATVPEPKIDGPAPNVICPDCLDAGRDVWAHLRMCLECGHVGCCDSSPYKHATAHHEATGHPVMRSFEPGESWRWCYVDRRLSA